MNNFLSATLIFVFMSFTMVYGQWSSDPGLNFQVNHNDNSEVAVLKMANMPNGDYYFGHFSLENSNYNVRLQRADRHGNILWNPEGVLVSSHSSMSWITDWDMTCDTEGNAVLAFNDVRSDDENNVVVYKIGPDGEFLWGEDGILLTDSDNFDVSPKLIVTGNNNVVISWSSTTQMGSARIMMQMLNSEGQKQWGDEGIVLDSEVNLTWPQLIAVGGDEFIMKYYQDEGPFWSPTRNIFAQKFNAQGEGVWEEALALTNNGNITAWTQMLSFEGDGQGGFYLAWHNYSISSTIASVWMQHVNAQGEVLFEQNGLLLSNRDNYQQFNPTIHFDESVFYSFWRETNGDQNNFGLYGQKVNMDGDLLWGDGANALLPLSSIDVNLIDAVLGDEHILVIFEKSNQIRALKLDYDGELLDENEILISSVNSVKSDFLASNVYKGQFVLSWIDSRLDPSAIFAQNVTESAALGVHYFMDIEVEGNGVVELNGEVLSYVKNFLPDTEIALEAMADEQWIFESWVGAFGESSEQSLAFSMDSDIDAIAKFRPAEQYPLSLSVYPENAAQLIGAGEYFEEEEVTIEAQANEGFVFLGWFLADEEEEFSAEEMHTFIMPNHELHLLAKFQGSTNTEDTPSTTFQIYPNPSKDHMLINANFSITQVVVYDLMGKEVRRWNVDAQHHHKMSVAELNPGMYLVSVLSESGESISKPILKQ